MNSTRDQWTQTEVQTEASSNYPNHIDINLHSTSVVEPDLSSNNRIHSNMYQTALETLSVKVQALAKMLEYTQGLEKECASLDKIVTTASQCHIRHSPKSI